MSEIYNRIRSRRIELGLTVEELAKRMGYKDKSSISKIENGKADIPQSKVVAFARALNTTTAYLMGIDEAKERDSTEKTPTSVTRNGRTQEIIDLIESLPEPKKQEALNYVRYLSENAEK